MAMATVGVKMAVNSTAANQYANRPKDESFATLEEMIGSAQSQRDHSKEVGYNLKDLYIEPNTLSDENTIQLTSPKGSGLFTNWSFGQFARMIGAPAGYLRTLPTRTIADAMNHGIKETPAGTRAVILAQAPNGNPHPTIRSVTSDSYGRLWDGQLYDSANKQVFARGSVSGQPWIAPPTWSGDTAGTWRGDRDSFVVRVDGGSIVTDPSAAKDGRMYRGVLIRNSEVGAASLVIDWVLFEYICGNLNLWGAIVDRRFTRRHVGTRILSDTIRELATLSREWSQRSPAQDEAIIRGLITNEVAHTPNGVVDELRKIGYTKDQAELAVLTCEQHFAASPRSFWGIAQGTTKMSQAADYQDERYALDQLASKLMQKGRAKVTA